MAVTRHGGRRLQPTVFAPNIDFPGDMPNTAPYAKIIGAVGVHGRGTGRLGSQGIRSDRFSEPHSVRAGAAKTCSYKVMRRILRKIAEDDFGNPGDTSTLAEPAVVDKLIANRQNRK